MLPITLRRLSFVFLFVLCLGCGDPALKDDPTAFHSPVSVGQRVVGTPDNDHWIVGKIVKPGPTSVMFRIEYYTDGKYKELISRQRVLTLSKEKSIADLPEDKIEQIEVQHSNGRWYCATVLERKDKKVKVHFNGYTDACNTTVPESRTRKWSLNF